MIRKTLYLLLLILVFVGGVFVSAISHFGSPIVTIEIINNSGKGIKTAEIIHETGRFGEIQHRITSLAPSQKRQIRIWAPAESSYKLIVTFADQKQLTGGQGYIEPGYKVIETIEGDKINSDVKLFGGYGP
jgi:hypothetical protein